MYSTVVVIFAVGAGFLWLRNDSTLEITREATAPKKTQGAASLVAVATKSLLEDSDNDGLPNWEETLRKTNPNDPDTDKNGIRDGDEPYNYRTTQQKIDEIAGSISQENLTETQKFGRQFLVQYLEGKKQGKVLDEAATTNMANELVSTIAQNTSVVLYTTENIQTISQNTEGTLREYANRMGRIILRNSPAENRGAVALITEALQTENPEKLKQLLPLIESFRNSVTEALSVPVPSNLTEQHLGFLNALSVIETALSGLQDIFKDSLVAMVRTGQYEQGVQLLKIALQNIADFYAQKNIIFEKSEEGAAFVGILSN